MAQHPGPHDALIIIDMINPFDFADGDKLLKEAEPVALRIARLKAALKAAGIPVIYANDNFTNWQNDFSDVVAICSHDGAKGASVAGQLIPETGDYNILKPQNSAFYNTPTEVLLKHLAVQRVVLTGIAADSCVLATAMDAHMRGFEVSVVRDCVASVSSIRNRQALALMKTLDAQIVSSHQLRQAVAD
jgi:nicotinamidase-related amidase